MHNLILCIEANILIYIFKAHLEGGSVGTYVFTPLPPSFHPFYTMNQAKEPK